MSEEKNSTRITLTTASLIRILAVLLLVYFAYLIQDILAILFVTVILSSALTPAVERMRSWGIPRALGISLIYFGMFAVFGLAFYLIIPAMAEQANQLANDLPLYLDRINEFLARFRDYTAAHGWLDNIKNSLGSSASSLQGAAGGVFSSIVSFFGGLFSLVIVLVITFYMIVEENAVKKLVWTVTPEKHQTYVMDMFNRVQRKMGLWIRGQLILCLIIFALTYFGLSLMGVKYALILALIAGLTEFIPYLGPFLGGIPAVFLAFTQSPTKALGVAVLYIVIQQVENNLLTPKIMQKAVGLNPIISIVAIMIGFSIGGIFGALLSIPVATAAMVVLQDLLHKKQAKESGEFEE
mgnify:CR=1 FL=1